jgi:DNA cross-link repair 1C protein
MPTGTPHNSCVLPYRIRVDDFSSNVQPAPLLHLLTHTHSDHINGLAARSFGYNVYCSEDAKQMLLRHEVYAEREYHEKDLRAEKIRTFSHLKVDPLVHTDGTLYYQGSRDLLVRYIINIWLRRDSESMDFHRKRYLCTNLPVWTWTRTSLLQLHY